MAKSTLGLIDSEFMNTEILSVDYAMEDEPIRTWNIDYDINTAIKENSKLFKKKKDQFKNRVNGGTNNLRWHDFVIESEPIKNFLWKSSVDAFKSIFKAFGKIKS